MSLAINPVKVVKVKDARIETSERREYAVIEGGQMYTMQVYDATSMSTSNMSFSNINPPADNSIVNKVVLVEVKYLVTLNANILPGSTIMDYWGSEMSLRCMPVNNSLQNLSVTLNSSTFSQDQNDLLPALSRINFRKLQNKLSYSPNALDNAQTYDELLGSNMNPLADAQTSQVDSNKARGGYSNIEFLTNTNLEATFRVTCTEPLLISPLDFDFNQNEPSFVRLTTCSVNGLFDPNISLRVLSMTENVRSILTGIKVEPKAAKIFFQYITPPVTQVVPKYLSYPYYGMMRYVTDNPLPLASHASTSYVTSNLQLQSIPKKVILFVKQTRSSLTESSPDVFARINSINVNFMNQTLMSSAFPEQLYAISKRNGVDMDYSDWYGAVSNVTAGSVPRQVSGTGSLIAMSPVLDWGLSDLLTSGSASQTQLSIQVNYTNLHPTDNLSFSLYLVIVSDGAITLSNQSCLTQDNVVGIADLVKTRATEPAFTNSDVIVQEMNGGNFFTDIKNFFTRNKDTIGKIASTIGKIAPHILPLIGLGGCADCGGQHHQFVHGCPYCKQYHESEAARIEGSGFVGGGYVGGRMKKLGRPSGSGLVGGAMLSKKKLRNLMID